MRRDLVVADEAVAAARTAYERALDESAPARAHLEVLELAVRDAERVVATQRLDDRMRELESVSIRSRGRGIEPPGR